jgi:hypothetical protein
MPSWETSTDEQQTVSLLFQLYSPQILFIGDSTNRGIMHYLIERVNGSLRHWHKTHDIKVYTNINEGRTNVSFAYYPRFWLPPEDRPVFDKTLHELFTA